MGIFNLTLSDRTRTLGPSQPDAVNPAIAHGFYVGRQGRVVNEFKLHGKFVVSIDGSAMDSGLSGAFYPDGLSPV